MLSWNQDKLVLGKYILWGPLHPSLAIWESQSIKRLGKSDPHYYIPPTETSKVFSLFFLVFFDSMYYKVLNVQTFTVNQDKKAITIIG